MTSAGADIGVLIYPGAQMSAVLGICDLFEIANGIALDRNSAGAVSIRYSHWKADAMATPECVFACFPGQTTPEVIVIPPSLHAPISPEQAAPIADWLRARHDAGTVLASICAGAFLLGETGLLAGRRVTTHWRYNTLFQDRFPEAQIDTDPLFIDGGDILTAGGLMAWTDMGLRLVERYLGPVVMVKTARIMLIDLPGREQRFYSAFVPRMSHGDTAILKVQQWMQANDGREGRLPEFARQAGLEERTFLRRFKKATGHTAIQYLQRLRVSKAQELLQFGDLPIDRIAWEVGYADPGAFRTIFQRIVGLSPGAFRKRLQL